MNRISAEKYIYEIREALRACNPCLRPGYVGYEQTAWKKLAKSIGWGLKDYSTDEIKQVWGSVYGIVPMCCLLASRPTPIDAKTFNKWMKEGMGNHPWVKGDKS